MPLSATEKPTIRPAYASAPVDIHCEKKLTEKAVYTHRAPGLAGSLRAAGQTSAAGRSWLTWGQVPGDVLGDDDDDDDDSQSSQHTPGSRRRTPPRRLQTAHSTTN